MRCDLRGTECPCLPGECKAAKPVEAPPMIRFSPAEILLISAAFGIAVYFAGGFALGRLDDSLHRQQLAAQEQTHHG